MGSRHSGSSIVRFLDLHSHAGPKVPVHVTFGCKRGLEGSAGGAKIDQKSNFLRYWPSEVPLKAPLGDILDRYQDFFKICGPFVAICLGLSDVCNRVACNNLLVENK